MASKVISVRLGNPETLFLDSVRGDLMPGEALKKIVRFLANIDHSYTKNTVLKAEINW